MRRTASIGLVILLIAVGVVPLLHKMRSARRGANPLPTPVRVPEYARTGGYVLDLTIDHPDRDALSRTAAVLRRRLDPDGTRGIELVSDEKTIEVRVPVPGGLSPQAKDWLKQFAALGSHSLWDQALEVAQLVGTTRPLSDLNQTAIDAVAAAAGEYEGAIRDFASACAAVEGSGTVGDPVVMVELICATGALELRMGTAPGETPKAGEFVWAPLRHPEEWSGLSGQGSDAALRELRSDPVAFLEKRGIVGVLREGRVFVQLGNTPANSVTRAQPGWAVESVNKTTDQIGRPALGYRLDAAGGQLMRTMTAQNVRRKMAVIVDGEVFTMPNLMTEIGERGVIEGELDPRELEVLSRTLSNPMPRPVRVVGTGQ